MAGGSAAVPKPRWLRVLVTLVGLFAHACGSASVSTSPNPVVPTPDTPPAGPYVVTIGPSGVNPQVLHVYTGFIATFVNNDDRAHSLFWDPHPAHTQCPGTLNVGPLMPGERREMRLQLGICYYHDDIDPGSRPFQGVLVIH